MGLNGIQPIEMGRDGVVKTPYVPAVPLTRGQRVKAWFRKYFLEGWRLRNRLLIGQNLMAAGFRSTSGRRCSRSATTPARESHLGGSDLHQVPKIRRYAHSICIHAGLSLMGGEKIDTNQQSIAHISRQFGGCSPFDTTSFNTIPTIGICP